jgi:hypothetical protein
MSVASTRNKRWLHRIVDLPALYAAEAATLQARMPAFQSVDLDPLRSTLAVNGRRSERGLL